MPPRFISLAILAFWLGTMTLLFFRDLWPDLQPGERPPYTIDLSKEALGRHSHSKWDVYRKGVLIGYANSTTHQLPQDDLYETITLVRLERYKFQVLGKEYEVRRLNNRCVVTQSGDLRELDSLVEIVRPSGEFVALQVKGKVEDGIFRPQWTPKSIGSGFDLPSEPVELRTHVSHLNPLQPWKRLLNIQPGQRWRMVLFDPMEESLAVMVPGARQSRRYLDAGVMETVQEHFWDEKDVPCFVIEYRGENILAKTWVRQSDGLVLRQEIERGTESDSDRIVLERNPK